MIFTVLQIQNTPNACTKPTDGYCGLREKAEHTVGVGCGLKMCSSSENSSSPFSPDGGFEFEEFLRGLDDPGVVAGQDAGAQEEAHVPVALQLVQAALLPQQAAQLHP